MARYRVSLDEDKEAPFSKGAGKTSEISQAGQWDYGYTLRMRNADDTADIVLISVNTATGAVNIGGVEVSTAGVVKFPATTPTAATGLTTGQVWRDPAAGNVLKMVP
jgi:hypothetical protein